jgi:hypothetical protein
MAFEHKSQPLLPRKLFLLRVARHLVFSILLIGLSLALGIFGYHFINGLSWIDALLNASMILTGMGPVNPLVNNSAKYFASFYAIFSGIVFLSTVAVFLAPVAHRFLHKLHLNEEDEPERS